MEVTALGSIVGTVFDYLPKIAVILAIIWYLLQIKESETWKNFMKPKPEEPPHE